MKRIYCAVLATLLLFGTFGCSRYDYKDVVLGPFGKQTIRVDRQTGEKEILGAENKWYKITMDDKSFSIPQGANIVVHH